MAHNALLSGCQPATKLKQADVNTKLDQKQNRRALAVRLKQFVRADYIAPNFGNVSAEYNL